MLRPAPRAAWGHLERNEDSWYRRWCREVDLGEGRVYVNPAFAGDPVFNHLTGIHAQPSSWRALLRRAEQSFGGAEPVFIFVSPLTRPTRLATPLRDEGYTLHDRTVIRTAARPLARPASGITVERVRDGTRPIWTRIFAAAFELPSSWMPEVDLRMRKLWRDPATALYLARLDGTPAGGLALHYTAEVGGIYCLGTLREFRRRGVARALLARAAGDAIAQGAHYVCLQHLSSDRVGSFYHRLGFRRAFVRDIFVRLPTRPTLGPAELA